MKKEGLSQEGLKLIACITMLLDHIGAVLLPGVGLRLIGRVAFPIYCFLLCEGVAHSRNPKRYFLRLGFGAVLAELPFDLLFYGGFTWEHQSVMVTLLLGFLMLLVGRKIGNLILLFVVCFFAAEFFGSDYGGWGIALIALFAATKDREGAVWMQLAGMAVIFCAMGSYRLHFGPVQIPIQIFGLLALIPISFYSGQKRMGSKWIQTAFYLFYPVHMAVLLLLQ